MAEIVTPAAVERRLVTLSQELDAAHEQLVTAEHTYMSAKSAWEINSAKARMGIKHSAAEKGVKVTIAEVEDEALMRCQDELMAYNTSEAVVKAARGKMARVRTQIDIARSIGTSVRSSIDIS